MKNMAQQIDGISENVHDCQKIFKTLMMALAFPGIPRNLDQLALANIDPEYAFALQPCITLLDLETSHYVLSEHSDLKKAIDRYIQMNTNSSSSGPETADFVLCLESSAKAIFKTLKRGSLSSPDKGATLIYHVSAIHPIDENIVEETVTLKGPGIKTSVSFRIEGLDSGEPVLWQTSRLHYPMGIDILLVSATGEIVGIPRSVTVIQSGVN